ncbi:MAG: DUF58 domain-containing protein [Phycisphaerales bacterium]
MLVRGSSRKPASIDALLDGRMMARLERLDLRSRRMFPGKLQGERRSKQRGQSVEFEDFRNYVPGDDLRFIDWNVYARLDRLFIKIFQEEQDMALHLAIDASASMDAGDPVPAGTERRGSATKLEHSARLAMALGYLSLAKQNRVTVSVFGAPGVRGVERLPDLRGRRAAHRLGGFLLDALWRGRESSGSAGTRAHASGEGGGFDDALSLVAKMRVGTGVFVVLSDFMDPRGYERGLRALATAGGYDTYCLQVLSKGELEPDPASISGDVRLLDAETGRASEVTVTAEVVKRYKRRLADYIAQLAEFCTAREMTHLLVRTDTPVETLVFETLRRLGMVG